MKIVQLHFVQRSMYDLLISKDFTADNLLSIFLGSSSPKKLSPITTSLLTCLNARVSTVLFNMGCMEVSSGNTSKYAKPLTEQEATYVKDEVEAYLISDSKDECLYSSNDEKLKCYEIVTHSTADTINLVIVVEKGFLSLVTTNLEELTSFYRELIRHSFGHEAVNFSLNREYLGLKMNPGYFDLVRLRADKRS